MPLRSRTMPYCQIIRWLIAASAIIAGTGMQAASSGRPIYVPVLPTRGRLVPSDGPYTDLDKFATKLIQLRLSQLRGFRVVAEAPPPCAARSGSPAETTAHTPQQLHSNIYY